MRHIIAAAASLATALGASLIVSQPAAAAPVRGFSDYAEQCKIWVEEGSEFESVGECMGFIASNSTSDPAQHCRTLRGFFPSDPWPFDNFGECVNYMREFED
jgi:hypothetical protein